MCVSTSIHLWPRSLTWLRCMCLLAGLLWTASGHAQGVALDLYRGITKVEVFANSAMVITGSEPARYQFAVYRLDALKNVEAAINQKLPKTEAAAREYFRVNQAEIKKQITPYVLSAANGIALARHYKIDRLPAVVVDGSNVIYGVPDVPQALALVQQHRAAAGKKR